MDRNKLKELWEFEGLSTRQSYSPAFCRAFCKKVGLIMPDNLIYIKDKYREQSNGTPRVDGENLLIFICESLNIQPNKEQLVFSRKLNGEGSRREAVQEAYLEVKA